MLTSFVFLTLCMSLWDSKGFKRTMLLRRLTLCTRSPLDLQRHVRRLLTRPLTQGKQCCTATSQHSMSHANSVSDAVHLRSSRSLTCRQAKQQTCPTTQCVVMCVILQEDTSSCSFSFFKIFYISLCYVRVK